MGPQFHDVTTCLTYQPVLSSSPRAGFFTQGRFRHPASGKNCTTNVGTPKVNEGTNGIGNRYGAGNNDQVTVVRGSVINICK